ncbi:hypothetical protein BG015_009045 [Linnemannia schmuckeri]|uniref:Uncharacterized protein n=1 Tax=Linnemannia schmuckeri TaxID=64567 RepID=A0A9P5RZM1_9FUNG|nr:hypothetical protein BG015_009045 [Linnemannia schmuckeri]
MTLEAETVSTHTVKNDATTTIVTRTTTIVSEHQEILAEPKDSSPGVVENVRRTFRDYWFPSHHHHHEAEDDDDDGDDEADTTQYRDPARWKVNGVMRRAYDYWKTLTQDADEAAKELVIEAKKARDEAAAEARWAYLGYKREAREAFEAADKKYKDALAAAERVHEEAHEKAKHKWFQAVDSTEKEVGEIKDQASEATHRKWDKFKSAVNSLAYNPPKYTCYPSGSQYWFSTGPSPAGTSWDCREIWDHPRRNDHSHLSIKTLPKKHLPLEKVHDTLTGLFSQAGIKAKHAPSASSFEAGLKPVRDQYHSLLDRVGRADEKAIDELDEMVDKIKSKLNELKFYEEQTDSWLTSQWNAVIDNAGDHKDHYERVFKNTLKNVKNTRTEAYNSLLNNLQRTINTSRNNINEAIRATKDSADKSRVHKAVQDANNAFTTTLKDAEAKIKSAPRNAYDTAIETFNRDTAYLKAKLEHAAHVASKSASSASYHASKSGSSISQHASKSGASALHHASKSGSSALHEASKSASSLSNHASRSASSAVHRVTSDAKSLADDAESKYHSATDKARQGYEHATASINSMWGSATDTPRSQVHKVKAGYHKTLDGVHRHWFADTEEPHELNVSSVYGSVLAIYFIYLAFRIWRAKSLARMSDPKQKTFTVVKNTDHANGAGEHTATIEKYRTKPSAEEALEKERDSFGTVLLQFTSVVPVTLILLVLLELSGFNRAALHTLFLGLITAQVMQGGLFNDALKLMGIVDGVHASGRDVGTYISWSVLALAALANAVKVLQAHA